MLCKKPVVFNRQSGVPMACGQCLPCRINQRRVWTNRLLLEAQYHASTTFLTITYSDSNLPASFIHDKTGQVFEDFSVNPSHHSHFIDNLRVSLKRNFGHSLRYYMVGEYGDRTSRPHYHYILFNFPACNGLGAQTIGRRFYPCQCRICSWISDTWGKGHIYNASFSLESAQYTCGYTTKKLTSDKCAHNSAILQGRHPEFSSSSRRPGIAYDAAVTIASYLDQNPDMPFPTFIQHGKKKLPLGRYLTDKIYELSKTREAPNNKLQIYKEALLDMCDIKAHTPQVAFALKHGSVAVALELINAQKSLNAEARFKLKEKKL